MVGRTAGLTCSPPWVLCSARTLASRVGCRVERGAVGILLIFFDSSFASSPDLSFFFAHFSPRRGNIIVVFSLLLVILHSSMAYPK